MRPPVCYFTTPNVRQKNILKMFNKVEQHQSKAGHGFFFVYLTEGAPVHVGAAHVEMLLVHHPQLGVHDASSQSLQVDLSDFCPWNGTKK